MSARSLTQTIRTAEREIQRHTSARSRPRTIWQRIGEPQEAFDARTIEYRRTLPRSTLLLAVCAPHPQPIDGVTLCEISEPALDVFHPAELARYRGLYGGRAGTRSWSAIRVLIALSIEQPLRIACFRELQNSLDESVIRLISDQITALGLERWFEVQKTSIKGANGSEFIFMGIKNDPLKVKSTEGIDIAFLEEAAKVSADSWQILIPTVRKRGSQIWAVFNPDQPDDPTYERFVTEPPPNSRVRKTSWRDNPWISPELTAEREYLARVDPDAYAWIWEGECRQHSDAQVFRSKYTIEAFEPAFGWDGPYYGADWGFSQDPTVLIRCWVYDRVLYIDHEAYELGCDIDRTAILFDTVTDARRHVIRADNARPETISHMQRNGYPKLTACEKWSGCVEDGIAHIRGYERVVIHPRCTHTAEEFRLYSYKVDRLSGDVRSDLKPGNDHAIDALRYALQPLIRRQGVWGFGSI